MLRLRSCMDGGQHKQHVGQKYSTGQASQSALVLLLAHPMRIDRERKPVLVHGSMKVWGIMRSTTTSAVTNAIRPLTDMNASELTIKCKYKTNVTKRQSKWCMVYRPRRGGPTYDSGGKVATDTLAHQLET